MAVGKWTQRRPREVQSESSKGSPSRERLAWGHLARLPDQASILGRGDVILKLVLFVTQPRPPAIPIPPKRDGGGIAAAGSQGTYLSQTALGRGEAGDPRASSQVNLSASSLPSLLGQTCLVHCQPSTAQQPHPGGGVPLQQGLLLSQLALLTVYISPYLCLLFLRNPSGFPSVAPSRGPDQ